MNSGGRPKNSPGSFDVAARIEWRRKSLGLTILQLAAALGLKSGSSYRYLEKQCSARALEEHGKALASALRVSVEWIATGEGEVEQVEVSAEELGPRVLPTQKMATPDELVRLADRAKRRRLSMKLSAIGLQREVGVSLMTVRKWEQQLPRVRKHAREEAWEAFLQVPVGWLRDETMEASPVRHVAPESLDSERLHTVADEIRAISVWLSRRPLQKKTYDRSTLNSEQQRHADVFAARYGVDGEDQSILDIIGDRYGVTRERIRQICHKMSERARPLSELVTPRLDQLVEALRPRLPMLVEDVDREFRALLGESLSVASVSRFATEILGRKVVTISEHASGLASRGKPSVVDPDTHDNDIVRIVRDEANSMIRSIGAANVFVVAGMVSAGDRPPVSPQMVTTACKIIEGFSWLAEKDGWFWFGPDRPLDNHLISVVRKVLPAAGQRVDVEDIQQACCRSRRPWVDDSQRPRLTPVELPSTVISAALAQTPWLRCVQKNDFEMLQPVPVEDVLSPVELDIYREIVAAGGICRRYGLYDALVKSGRMLHITFQRTLALSPIFAHLDFAVFAIRGWPWGEMLLARTPSEVSVGKREVHVDEAKGTVTFRFRMTAGATRNRILDIPSTARKLIPPGDYVFLHKGTENMLQISATGSSALRIGRVVGLLLKSGLKEGMAVDVVIHPGRREIRCEVVQLDKHDLDDAGALELADMDGG